MIRIGDQVLAVGGNDPKNNAPSKIAKFDPTTNAWVKLTQKLRSANTSELIVTPFPVSSLDCVPECRCGIANRRERIFGGSEAEVGSICGLCQFKASLFRPMLIPGLLLFCGMKTMQMVTSTASVVLPW